MNRTTQINEFIISLFGNELKFKDNITKNAIFTKKLI